MKQKAKGQITKQKLHKIILGRIHQKDIEAGQDHPKGPESIGAAGLETRNPLRKMGLPRKTGRLGAKRTNGKILGLGQDLTKTKT